MKIKEGDETTLYILLQMPQKGPRDPREHLLHLIKCEHKVWGGLGQR